MKNKIHIGLITLLMLLSSCKGIGQEENGNTSVNISDNENIIMEKFRKCPQESLEILLENILNNTNSIDKRISETAWKCLYLTWERCDGMKCQFVTRYFWNKCKEKPLLFYIRFFQGDDNAIKFYKLATLYDIKTFKSDRVTKSQFLNVLETVKKEIVKYNNKHSINGEAFFKSYDDYLTKAKEINR